MRFIGTIALAHALSLAGAAAAAEGPRAIGRHGAWVVFANDGEGGGACFAATQPKSSEPAVAEREPAFVYVSAWPKEGVRTQLSIRSGYRFRAGSVVTVTIGPSNFALFTTGDRAWVSDPTAELKLIDAMKKGPSMRVQGVSDQGTTVRDVYELGGLTQSLAAIVKGCG